MSHTVLITFPPFVRNHGRHTELLREAGVTIRTSMSDRPLSAEEMLPLVVGVDAIIAGGEKIDAQVFAAADRLKVISRHGVGYDAIDLQAATAAGVVVTITPGTNEISVAELALGLMIGIARRISLMRDMLLRGDWARMPGVELAGKVLGIVGLGRVGKALATRARAMDMTVLAHDIHQDLSFAAQHSIAYVPLDQLLRTSDFVSLHTPGVSGACALIGEQELRSMKPSAYLINTARGSLIDEEALYRGLTESWLAGAALDVFAKEPPDNHRLLSLENVLATPHIGGTREAGARTALLSTENALQVLRGERCPHTVNPDVYELMARRER
jgi:phosphoglycerate dehydrogenase-like enzyme